MDVANPIYDGVFKYLRLFTPDAGSYPPSP